MNKTSITLILVAALLGLGLVVYVSMSGAEVSQEPDTLLGADAKNATYTIDGRSVKLVNGVAEEPAAPGSSSKITTRYFGNEVASDLNGDGRTDVAFIISQETGGSGTFYYAVGALNTPGGYIGSHGVLLGDRIAPQPTTAGEGSIVVFNYADRAQGEDFAVPPSIGKSIWLKLDPSSMQFGEVAQNFEGESDPSVMKLDMKPWSWVSTDNADGSKIVPLRKDAFVLTFTKPNTFSAKTDCNGVGGNFAVKGDSLALTNMMSTLMFCEGSQEAEFNSMLSDVERFQFTSKGELIFTLKSGKGSALFK